MSNGCELRNGLSFADREAYYGDPNHVDVPMEALLSEEYAAERRKLIDEIAAALRTTPEEAPARVAQLLEDRRKLEREAADLRKKLAAGGGAGGPAGAGRGVPFPPRPRPILHYFAPDFKTK